MHVIAGLEIRVHSALRGLFYRSEVDLFVCFFRVTVPACFDGTRGGSARRPARGLVWPGSSMPKNVGEPA